VRRTTGHFGAYSRLSWGTEEGEGEGFQGVAMWGCGDVLGGGAQGVEFGRLWM